MTMDLSGFVRKKTTVTIGRNAFTFTELSIGDLAEFKAYLMERKGKRNEERRGRIIADAKKIGGVDPLELLKVSDSQITEEEFGMEMEAIEGICYLAFLSLRYHHIGISREQAAEIVTPGSMEIVTKAMFPIQGVEEDKKKPKAKRSRKRPR